MRQTKLGKPAALVPSEGESVNQMNPKTGLWTNRQGAGECQSGIQMETQEEPV